MKQINILLGLVIVFLFFFIIKVSSEDFNLISLKSGKNLIYINSSSSFYVSDLIKLNPSIEVVSYNFQNKSIGYVNIFGGIGENFLIENNIEYEIIVNKDINLILPNNP